MNAADTQTDILDLVKQHEESLALLYSAYADRFPEHGAFWGRLADEETQHAAWVDYLRERLRDDEFGRIVNRFPRPAIEHSIAYVNRLIEEARHGETTDIRAMANALDLEQALIESRYFECVEGDSPELKHTLSLLADSTHEHFERIQAAWARRQ